MTYLYDHPTSSYYVLTTDNILLQIFLFLQIIGGLILLPLLLFTFLVSKSATRDVTLNNLLFCFIITAISASLSVVTGDPHLPSTRDWCVAQSILICASLPMASTASCTLILNLLVSVYLANHRPSWAPKWQTWRYPIVLGIPYGVGVAFAVTAALTASLHPGSVSTSVRVYFCNFINYGLADASLIFTGSVLMLQLLMQAVVFTAVVRNWRIMRHYKSRSCQLDAYAICIRVSIFSAWAAVAGASALITVWYPSNTFPGMAFATIPSGAFLVFGTQRDVLAVWRFWGAVRPKVTQLAQKSDQFDKLDALEKLGKFDPSDSVLNFRRHSV